MISWLVYVLNLSFLLGMWVLLFAGGLLFLFFVLNNVIVQLDHYHGKPTESSAKGTTL